jgi:hypothetical protein
VNSPINGRLHIIAPGRFIVFHAPSLDVPEGRDWFDLDGVRHFSTDFYAELLGDLGVSLVLRLDDGEGDDLPFHSRGIAVERAPAFAGPTGRVSFQTLDRLLALAAHAGTVAVQSPSAGGPGAGGECALLAMGLFRLGAFPSPEPAFAWLQLACPGPHLPLERAFPAAAAGAGARRRASCISALASDSPPSSPGSPGAPAPGPPAVDPFPGGRRFSAPQVNVRALHLALGLAAVQEEGISRTDSAANAVDSSRAAAAVAAADGDKDGDDDDDDDAVDS